MVESELRGKEFLRDEALESAVAEARKKYDVVLLSYHGQAEYRITSYNVCYTKLLRYELSKDGMIEIVSDDNNMKILKMY